MTVPEQKTPERKTGETGGEAAPVVVKKYANRRLYNTESSSYITLDSLADMVRIGRDFVVYDAKTGDDITRGVLTQIIVEEEGKGSALLPTGFLRQLIGFYGNSMQGLVPRYLEQAMSSFGRQQQQMRTAMQTTMGPFFPFGIEEVGRQNMAMMERAMSLFTPFYRGEPSADAKAGETKTVGGLEEVVATLEAEVESLRGQLAGALVDNARAEALRDELARSKAMVARLDSELAAARAAATGATTGAATTGATTTGAATTGATTGATSVASTGAAALDGDAMGSEAGYYDPDTASAVDPATAQPIAGKIGRRGKTTSPAS